MPVTTGGFKRYFSCKKHGLALYHRKIMSGDTMSAIRFTGLMAAVCSVEREFRGGT